MTIIICIVVMFVFVPVAFLPLVLVCFSQQELDEMGIRYELPNLAEPQEILSEPQCCTAFGSTLLRS